MSELMNETPTHVSHGAQRSATTLDDIPSAGDAPMLAQPSLIVARLRAYRPGRRTVLRGLLIAAAASTLVPLDWFLSRRQAVASQGDGGSNERSEYSSCQPDSYAEQRNNWWEGGPATCFGGWRRGSFPCQDGFHREGSFSGNGESFTSTRLTSNCHRRNAWRWHGYRCSDAITTTVFADGDQYNGVTIAACGISDSGGGDQGVSGDETSSVDPRTERSGGADSGGADGGSGAVDSGSADSGSGAVDSGGADSGSGGVDSGAGAVDGGGQ